MTHTFVKSEDADAGSAADGERARGVIADAHELRNSHGAEAGEQALNENASFDVQRRQTLALVGDDALHQREESFDVGFRRRHRKKLLNASGEFRVFFIRRADFRPEHHAISQRDRCRVVGCDCLNSVDSNERVSTGRAQVEVLLGDFLAEPLLETLVREAAESDICIIGYLLHNALRRPAIAKLSKKLTRFD